MKDKVKNLKHGGLAQTRILNERDETESFRLWMRCPVGFLPISNKFGRRGRWTEDEIGEKSCSASDEMSSGSDKVQQKDATLQHNCIAEKMFDLVKSTKFSLKTIVVASILTHMVFHPDGLNAYLNAYFRVLSVYGIFTENIENVKNMIGVLQCKREGFIQEVEDEVGKGCNIHGSLEVNKVPA
ncbi:Endoplasmic reticulum vesicle transporter [Forsythia ovata]|uniref:Endoplasmic reticulum vesicle transporter n=1 Tax=Forsythia ovata TaxID=205694 RepID=A0ABD1NWD3_9LAMI